MSLVQEILYTLSNYPGGYRVIYDIIYDGQAPGKNKKKSSENILRATLSRMKKDGLLRNKKRGWSITLEGEELLDRKNSDIKKFFPNQETFKQDQEKRLIVIFDIPEKKKRYREWLRSELVGFGFELVQKSVWLGPVLPREFVEYLSEIELLIYIKFFRATEKDLI